MDTQLATKTTRAGRPALLMTLRQRLTMPAAVADLMGWLSAIALVTFILLPLVAIVAVSLAKATYWHFPPQSFTFAWYERLLANSEFRRSLFVSLGTAALVGIFGTALGLLASLGIARGRHNSGEGLATIALLPLLFPTVALGVAIYTFYLRVRLPINIGTLALAQLVLVLPFTIRLLTVALNGLNPNLEKAALNLGASPRRTVISVTLPQISMSITAAVIFGFIRSFDDAGIALFVNDPKTITVPVRLLFFLDTQSGPLIAAGSSILLIVGLLVVLIVSATIGLERAYGVKKN
ncbi:MAG: ABC transporter permease subunit [Ardenticatenaceae bacterium]|nr:ABC transporter permease subunit [Ardenticatenaceae bacterium]